MKIIDVQGFSVKRQRRRINHRRSWRLSPTGELAALMPCWNHDGFAETPSHSDSELRSGFPLALWGIIKDNFSNFSKNLQAKTGGREETWLHTSNEQRTFPIWAGSELFAALVGVPSLSEAQWGLIVGMEPPQATLCGADDIFLTRGP